jgi:hypothetical protein
MILFYPRKIAFLAQKSYKISTKWATIVHLFVHIQM